MSTDTEWVATGHGVRHLARTLRNGQLRPACPATGWMKPKWRRLDAGEVAEHRMCRNCANIEAETATLDWPEVRVDVSAAWRRMALAAKETAAAMSAAGSPAMAHALTAAAERCLRTAEEWAEA